MDEWSIEKEVGVLPATSAGADCPPPCKSPSPDSAALLVNFHADSIPSHIRLRCSGSIRFIIARSQLVADAYMVIARHRHHIAWISLLCRRAVHVTQRKRIGLQFLLSCSDDHLRSSWISQSKWLRHAVRPYILITLVRK
jgi:hypothetical protein